MAEIYIPGQEELGRRRFPDNKGYRKQLYDSSINYLSQIQGLLPSNYPHDYSTDLAQYNRVMAREFARLNSDINFLNADKQYTTTRIKYLHQILGERLFLGDKITPTNYNNETYRDFLISIKNAYLAGSKKRNIEALASKFTGQRIQIKELYFEARKPDSSLDVSDTHMMVVDVFIDDMLTAGYNISTLKRDLDFFINITRPAHVLYDTRLIWTEQIDVNKVHDIIFGDTGGGCIPVYDYDYFEEPTILAQQIFILDSPETATGQIDSIHHEDLIFYFTDSTRVIVEPLWTKIYNTEGRQVTFNELKIDQYVRITYQTIPGEFKFWWYPSQILPTWSLQFYRDVYRRPVFQEFVKKIMDSKGRFPLQIKTTPTTVCDRWVHDVLQPLYEDLRGVCNSGSEHTRSYSVTLSERKSNPNLSLPYERDEIHDNALLGSDFIYWLSPTPLTDGSSNPASPTDVSIWLDGTALPDPVYSVDSSSGKVTLFDTTSYWDDTAITFPIPGDELTFSYHYLSDGTNYNAISDKIYGITYWQMPHNPLTQGDGTGKLATVDDIDLSVDGTSITDAVAEVTPLLGHVVLEQSSDFWNASELGRIPQIGDVFKFDYYWGKKYEYPLLFDDIGRTHDTYIGSYNTGFVFDATSSMDIEVDPVPSPIPLEIGYRYRAYLLHHSSVLNSPDTLTLNDFQKPAKRASIINQEETLNHFNIFFSPEFLYDTQQYILNDKYLENGLEPVLKLREGTPPFQKTFSYHPKLIESKKLQDIRTNHELLLYSDLLLKEFRSGDDEVNLSSICDSDNIRFEIFLGEDTYPGLQECPPWILFDTVQIDNVEVNIPGDYIGIPNLRVSGMNLRDNFILREIEPTGTAVYTYQVYTPFNAEPPTEFYLPSSFKFEYDDDLVDFPALPVVNASGGLATIADIQATVNGIPWTVTGLDPVTGWIQIAAYPETTVIELEHVLTAQDAAANRMLLPGWPTNPIITFTPIHGTAQYQDEDFYLDGRYVSWFGTAIHGIPQAGDRIRLSYTINSFVDVPVEFTYRIRSYATLPVINDDWSRIHDNGYVFGGPCPDGPVIDISTQFNEYFTFLDDYSEGIKIAFFNKDTLNVEEHLFSGPVFEFYDMSEDELGHPDNFPNALIRIQNPAYANNPLNYQAEYGFLNDKVVRFRKKTLKELLPTRTFRTMEFIEMLPV